MTGFGYLAALLVSSGAMLLIDHRFRLYLFADTTRALAVQGIGVAAFVVWDLVCIQLGIFGRGDGPFLTGWEIVPHLTIEEPIFLWFLCHFTMIVLLGADRLLAGSRTAGTTTSREAGR
ncbi:MAG: lycopene cyclase domain-containing protein [Brachybacterium sp.]|nr:lycopene cyclase domain-containing protein [Brachybacterium sp.]